MFRLLVAASIIVASSGRASFAASALTIHTLPLCRSHREQRPTDYFGKIVVLEITESASVLNGMPIRDPALVATIPSVSKTRLPKVLYFHMNDDLPYGRFIQRPEVFQGGHQTISHCAEHGCATGTRFVCGARAGIPARLCVLETGPSHADPTHPAWRGAIARLLKTQKPMPRGSGCMAVDAPYSPC